MTCVTREAGSSCVAMTTSLSWWWCCTVIVLKQTRRFSPSSMTVSRSRLRLRLAASCSAISCSVWVTSLGNCVSSSLPHSWRRRAATSLAVPENFSSAYLPQLLSIQYIIINKTSLIIYNISQPILKRVKRGPGSHDPNTKQIFYRLNSRDIANSSTGIGTKTREKTLDLKVS